jgi:AcrR family transcriptional regulator
MKRKPRKDAIETRQRLLAAAARVFAAKGFWEATHSEICREARANTAAVNYHFGSKENLYVEAWKYSFERSVEAHPPDGGVPPEAPVRARLRGRVLAFMQRIADPDNYEIEIMHKEMANPTGLLTEAVQQAIERMRQGLRAIVQELLGEGAAELQVSFCVMSLVGQCFGPMLHLRQVRLGRGTPPPIGPPFAFRVEELADHVTQFSLAGIRGIRAETAQALRNDRKHRAGRPSARTLRSRSKESTRGSLAAAVRER